MGGTQSGLKPEEVDGFRRSRLFSEQEIHTLYLRFQELGGSRTKAIPIEKVINMEEFRYNPFRFRIGAVFGENVLQEAARETMISGPGSLMAPQGAAAASGGKESKEEKKEGAPAVPTGVLIQTQAQLMRPNLKEKVCTFARFLELFEAFSVRLPFAKKVHWAFLMYDFNGDGMLDAEDMQCLLRTLVTREDDRKNANASCCSPNDSAPVPEEAVFPKIANMVLDESDMDKSRTLSEDEFSRIMRKFPEFLARFQLTPLGF